MRFIAIILFSVALMMTPLAELLKVPALISHFIKHQANTGINLQEFLTEHYNPDHNDQDIPEDNNLPFKNVIVVSMAATLPVQFSLPPGNHYYHRNMSNYEVFFPNAFKAALFHPPRPHLI